MTRKVAAAVSIASDPRPAPPESSPIVTRKRARRVPAVALAPKPVPIAIDLARMTSEQAKKALSAAYPRHAEDKVIEATEATDRAVLSYMNARDAATISEGHKEAAGNVLRLTMGDAAEIHGEGYKVTWKTQKSEIDWSALVKELNIPSDQIERFRKPERRVLNVREVVTE